MSVAGSTKVISGYSAFVGGAISVMSGLPWGIMFGCSCAALGLNIKRGAQSEEKIFLRVMGILFDIFVGAAITAALFKLRSLESYGVHDIPDWALGGLVTLSLQFLRQRVAKWGDELWATLMDALKAALKRRFGGQGGN